MRSGHSRNNILFISLHSCANVARLMVGSPRLVRTLSTGGVRAIVDTGNIISLHSTRAMGSGVSANGIRIVMDRFAILKEYIGGLPFRVFTSGGSGRTLELGRHFLSLEGPGMDNDVEHHSRVVGCVHHLVRSRNFLRVRAPVLATSSPRNTHSFLMPDHGRPNRFCTLPRTPRRFGRLLVISNFSECFRVTPYFHSRSTHTSHSPNRFCRLSFRVTFTARRRILTIYRHMVHTVFGGFRNARRPMSTAPFERVAFGRSVLGCNGSGPSLEGPLVVYSLASFFGGIGFPIFGNGIMETVITPYGGRH